MKRLFLLSASLTSAVIALAPYPLSALDENGDNISDVFSQLYPGHLPNEDRDGDGYTTLEEYLLGGNPNVPDLRGLITVEQGAGGRILVHGKAAQGLGFQLEQSLDLNTWTRLPEFYHGEDNIVTIELDIEEAGNSYFRWVGVGPLDSMDGDELNDREEFLLGTDPTLWDTDGDGISDSDEFLNGTDPLDPSDPGPVDPPDSKPEIAITLPLPGSNPTYSTTDTVRIEFTASDPDGLDLTNARLTFEGTNGDAQAATNVSGDLYAREFSDLAPGDYIVTAFARDTLGNISSAESSFTVEEEELPTGQLIEYPVNGATLSRGDVEVRVDVPAGTDSVEYFINGYNVSDDVDTGTNESFTFRNLQGGTYIFSVVLTDSGVKTTDQVTVTITPENIRRQYNFRRLNGSRPVIDEQMFLDLGAPDDEGDNNNGAHVIRVPDWLPDHQKADPSAVYYMYFANHSGGYIRLAWAVDIEGPWHLHDVGTGVNTLDRGVLSLDENDELRIPGSTITLSGHIASPEVHVDHVNRRFIMYFHGQSSISRRQKTFASISDDGLDFTEGLIPGIFGVSYFTVWEYMETLYAFDNAGSIYRAPYYSHWDYILPGNVGDDIFDQKKNSPIEAPAKDNNDEFDSVRHVKTLVEGDTLYSVFTLTREAPEQLYYATMQLSDDVSWRQWEADYPYKKLATPEAGWEGGHFPLLPSERGGATKVNQFRDPCIFKDIDGEIYVFYSGSGESAIGVAKLEWVD